MNKLIGAIKRMFETDVSIEDKMLEEKLTCIKNLFGRDAVAKVKGMGLDELDAIYKLGLAGVDIDNAIAFKFEITPEQTRLIVDLVEIVKKELGGEQ